jgi:hypothetical protein
MQQTPPGHWTPQPLYTLEAMGPLHDLNRHFLDLLADRENFRACTRAAESATLACALAALTPAQRAQAARCPYALFDLRFQDAEHWRQRLEGTKAWRIEDAEAPGHERLEFVHVALFYAWHVAWTGQLAAQVMLGMPAGTAHALRVTALNSLPALAPRAALELKARFSPRGSFWSSLIRSAARGDAAQLKRVQLFGLQLAAAAHLP